METLPANSPLTTLDSTQVESLIAMAIEKNINVESLERLLAMRKELKQEYIESQFNKAMATFQQECPIIKKNKVGAVTKTGAVVSKYAPLDSIISQVKGLIFKNGFHYDIDTEPAEKGVHIYITVTHELGYSKKRHVYMPYVERTGVMTDAHVEMATMTIATRRVFCNAFGIITGEEDKDGFTETQRQEHERVTQSQLTTIEKVWSQSGLDKKALLEKYHVKGFNTLTKSQALDLINKLSTYNTRIQSTTKETTHTTNCGPVPEDDDDIPYEKLAPPQIDLE